MYFHDKALLYISAKLKFFLLKHSCELKYLLYGTLFMTLGTMTFKTYLTDFYLLKCVKFSPGYSKCSYSFNFEWKIGKIVWTNGNALNKFFPHSNLHCKQSWISINPLKGTNEIRDGDLFESQKPIIVNTILIVLKSSGRSS